jgi:hypothetical protein
MREEEHKSKLRDLFEGTLEGCRVRGEEGCDGGRKIAAYMGMH